jgi:hypothetical protein
MLRAALVIFLLCCMVHSVSADVPTILLLQRTQTSHQARQTQTLQAETYPYGYFGAQPSAQWSRHYGYYNAYRQWTRR